MGAVAVEKPTKRPDRLALLRRTLDERKAERDKLHSDVLRLRDEEQQALAQSVREAPTRRPFGLGTPIQRSRARREKLERRLPDLDMEIAELERVAAEEQAERAGKDIADAVRRLRASSDRQRACWERAAALLVDVADAWADLAAEIGEADSDAGRVLASDAYRLASDEAKGSLVAAASAVALVTPCPRSFAGFVGRLVEASQSSENMAPDFAELEFGQGSKIDPKTGQPVLLPPRLAKVESSARRLDDRKVLRDVVPDLRAAPAIRPSQRFELLGGSPSVEML